jgi:CP12 domain
MENIDVHIEQDKKILDDPQTSPQARRHTQEELAALEAYKQRHPEDNHDPSALELYCDSNPEAMECKIYDT